MMLGTILIGAIGSLLAAALMFIFGLLFPSIRYLIFYTKHEYQLKYNTDFNKCFWTIAWEKQFISIDIEKVHDDFLEKFNIRLNNRDKGETYPKLDVSDKFNH